MKLKVHLDQAPSEMRSHSMGASATIIATPGGSSIDFSNYPQVSNQVNIKRALDVFLASVGLLFCLPVCLVIMLMIVADGHSAFFVHQRVGRGGRTFGCLKFRTMSIDADQRMADLLAKDPDARAEWETAHKLLRDPRVTPIGRVLRTLSLDELPQLLNVLRGDMSLVGPRPVTESELELKYGPASKYYKMVRPGLTGLWQVSGRNDLSYERRIELDLLYVKHPSICMDLKIMLKTIPRVVSGFGSY